MATSADKGESNKTRRVNTPDGKEIITMALDGRLAIKAADTGSKIARLAAGMETDKVKGKLGGHIEVEDVEAMRRKRWEQVVPRLAQALKDAGVDEDAGTDEDPGEEEKKDV